VKPIGEKKRRGKVREKIKTTGVGGDCGRMGGKVGERKGEWGKNMEG